MQLRFSNLYERLFPEAVCRLPQFENKVFITFDDGPCPEVTPWVLDILDEYNSKATFFCTGRNVQKYPELFDRIISRGHAIGNHGYEHRSGLMMSAGSYMEDAKKASELIKSKMFRPPYGRITQRQYRELIKEYQVILWSRMTYDFSSRRIRFDIDRIQPGDIIVLHDSLKAAENLKRQLPAILRYLTTKRIEAIPISF